MKLRRLLRRRFSVAARPVTVRSSLPWYWRWAGLVVVGVGLLFLGNWIYHFGMEFAGFSSGEAGREREQMSEQLAGQNAALADLRARLASSERQLDIERAAYSDLTRQVKTLTAENAAIKEDLAFFQSLMPAAGREGVSINRFRVQAGGLPGEYRYQLLLVQTGQRAREFRGNLQLVVNLQRKGTAMMMTLPQEGAGEAQAYQLNFKFFQRVEGTFRVQPDTVIRDLQVRVFESGVSAPKVTQSITVS
jgi:hypothetical protein